MTSEQQDPLPPRVGWVIQPKPSSSERPGWALPLLGAGFVCSLLVAKESFQYYASLARGVPPPVAQWAAWLEPVFLVVGLPLMLFGAPAAARPWSPRRPWLQAAVVAAVIVWFLVVLQGPALLFAKSGTEGTGTVDGLPGQQVAWSGAVTCSGGQEAGREVVAAIPAAALSRDALATSLYRDAVKMADGDGTAYELHVNITGDRADFIVRSGGFGAGLSGATVDVAQDGTRGKVVSEPRWILHTDDPPSVVTLTWDCGGAP